MGVLPTISPLLRLPLLVRVVTTLCIVKCKLDNECEQMYMVRFMLVMLQWRLGPLLIQDHADLVNGLLSKELDSGAERVNQPLQPVRGECRVGLMSACCRVDRLRTVSAGTCCYARSQANRAVRARKQSSIIWAVPLTFLRSSMSPPKPSTRRSMYTLLNAARRSLSSSAVAGRNGGISGSGLGESVG